MNFKDDIENYFSKELSVKQIEQFQIYYEFLVEYNKNVNLTSITEEQDVFYKHFFDSVTPIRFIDFDHINSVCDMGSGAGFPSFPLKIMYPHLKITIIDSLNKRLTFLNQLIEKLEFSDICLVHDRIEKYALNHQNEFDLVTARALGELSLISEMGIPMTKVGGIFLAFKGQNIDEELENAKNTVNKLGAKIDSVHSFELPYQIGSRSLIHIVKIKDVRGYPRSFQLIKSKPL